MASSTGIPISRTVDPKLPITTTDQALDLERAFDKAWGPLDDDGAQPASADGAQDQAIAEPPQKEEPPKDSQVTRELLETKRPETEPRVAEPEIKEPKTETKPVEVKPADGAEPHPDDEPDEELDKIRLHPDSRPEVVSAFRQMRGMLKTERKVVKELRDRFEKTDAELKKLNTTVRPVSDPTVQAELEDLRGFKAKHQIFDDSEYHTNYEQPVRLIFDDIVKDVKALANDPAAAESWEKDIRAAGPDQLDRDYWNEGVIKQCSDPLHRERLIRKISLLLDSQQRRNEFRQQMAEKPDAYSAYVEQQKAENWKRFSIEAEDEAKKITSTLGEWANPKDLTLAKSQAERTAFEAHNKVYQEYEDLFKYALTDAATQGPRGITRIAIQAVLAEKYKRDLEVANTKLGKLQNELRAAQDELNKIAGARSKVSHSSGATAGGRSPETSKRKIGQSVEDAFSDFFGRQ